MEDFEDVITEEGELATKVMKKRMDTSEAFTEMDRQARSRDVALGQMLRWRVRYFTDGAVINHRSRCPA